MLAGPALFCGVLLLKTFVLNAGETPVATAYAEMLQIASIALSAGAVLLGQFFFKKRLKAVQAETRGKERLEMYRSTLIIQWALLEGAIILNAIFYFLTQNLAFIGLAAVLLLILFMVRPTELKTTLHTGLSPDQFDVNQL